MEPTSSILGLIVGFPTTPLAGYCVEAERDRSEGLFRSGWCSLLVLRPLQPPRRVTAAPATPALRVVPLGKAGEREEVEGVPGSFINGTPLLLAPGIYFSPLFDLPRARLACLAC